MLILGIDTSASPCCAAVYDTEKDIVLAESKVNNLLTHSVTLMPIISDMLKNAEIKISDIDLFAVTKGPGSFTGLRIGISAVKGMAFANEKPCAAVTANEAVAYGLTDHDGIICSCIDAKIGQIYNAVFRCENKQIERLSEERCLKAEELATELSDKYGDEKIILCGDSAELIKELLPGDNVKTASPTARYQSGGAVCLAAKDKEVLSPDALMPMYLKLPQAQRELMAKQSKEKSEGC